MRDAVDIHTHIVPSNLPPYAGKNVAIPWPEMAHATPCHKHVLINGNIYRTVSDACWDVGRRLEGMETLGIGRQALSPMPELLSYWLPLPDACVLIRYLNDQIGEMVARSPHQFTGFGAVPLQDIEAAVKELAYLKRSSVFTGVEIGSHVNGVSIGEARFDPFFAAAEYLGLSIFVHSLRPIGRERLVGAFPEQAVCFPGDIGLAAASIITGGVAARHPQLRIAFSHGGGALPIMLPRMTHIWREIQRVRESLPEEPASYAKRFYYDTLVIDPVLVKLLVDTFGVSQLLIGTDYPFFPMKGIDPATTLQRAGLKPEDIAAIAVLNANRFLGLV